jgi:sulfate adenylyltransferase subunit 2
MRLIVYTNPQGRDLGINPFVHGSAIHTDFMKTQALKQALDKYGFDCASRAKERILSFRSTQHRWDPKNQRRSFGSYTTCASTKANRSGHSR